MNVAFGILCTIERKAAKMNEYLLTLRGICTRSGNKYRYLCECVYIYLYSHVYEKGQNFILLY